MRYSKSSDPLLPVFPVQRKEHMSNIQRAKARLVAKAMERDTHGRFHKVHVNQDVMNKLEEIDDKVGRIEAVLSIVGKLLADLPHISQIESCEGKCKHEKGKRKKQTTSETE